MPGINYDDRWAELIRRLEELALKEEELTKEYGDVVPPTPAARQNSFHFLERILNEVDTSSYPFESAALTPSAKSSPGAGTEKPSITQQIFFDCDNTLVETEYLTAEAATEVVNKCVGDHGIDYTYTLPELLFDFFGTTAKQMLPHIAEKHNFELTLDERKAYEIYEEDLVIDLIHANPKPCAGIHRILEAIQATGRYNLSVVSSSPIRRIRAAIEAAGLTDFFAADQVFSAKSSMPTPKSKPDPAIYLWAMEQNQVWPWQCIAIEDSISGAQSAVGAGIPCIGYVGAYPTPDMREQIAETLTDAGCKQVIHKYSQFDGVFQTVEAQANTDFEAGNVTFPESEQEKRIKNYEEFMLWVKKLLRDDPAFREQFNGWVRSGEMGRYFDRKEQETQKQHKESKADLDRKLQEARQWVATKA